MLYFSLYDYIKFKVANVLKILKKKAKKPINNKKFTKYSINTENSCILEFVYGILTSKTKSNAFHRFIITYNR